MRRGEHAVSAPFDFGPARRTRRPSLTPLVDVVFLLLVFFMLASRFGAEAGLALAPAAAGQGGWEGPPRLVSVAADGVALNGAAVGLDGLAAALAPLMPAPDAPIVVRVAAGATVQGVVDALAALDAAGYRTLVVLE
jgi:biopolymer transport protein ExbD